MTAAEAKQIRRIYVGGLFPEILPDDLRNKFARFGSVEDVQIKVRRDEQGEPVKTFAYLNINGTKKELDRCFSTFSRAKWKGSTLVLQTAKENFLTKLEKERGEAALPQDDDRTAHLHDPLAEAPGVQDFVMRGAVPGTPIPGEKNWVVGKYGRVLPIVHLKKQSQHKIVRVDPSKLCHNLKKLKDDGLAEKGQVSLTWTIGDQDSDITRKRKGEFPVEHKKSKRAASQMVMDFLTQQKHRHAKVVKEANNFEILLRDGTVKNNSGQQNGSSRGKGSLDKVMAPEKGSSDQESADTDEIIAATKSKTAGKKKTNAVRQPSKRFQEHYHSSDSESETGDVQSESFVYVAGKKGAKPGTHVKKSASKTPSKLNLKSSASDSSSGDSSGGEEERDSQKKGASQEKGGGRPTDCSNRESSESESYSSSDEASSMEHEDGQLGSPDSSKDEKDTSSDSDSDPDFDSDCDSDPDSDRNQPQSRRKSGIPEFRGRAVLDQGDVSGTSPPGKVAKKSKDQKPGVNDSKKPARRSMDAEDTDSTGSADTDEILATFRKSSRTTVPPAGQSKTTSAPSSAPSSAVLSRAVDEFSCGFSVDGGRIVYPQRVMDSGEESDSSQEYRPSKKQKKSLKEESRIRGDRSANQKTKLAPGTETMVMESVDRQARKSEEGQRGKDVLKSSDKSRIDFNNTGREKLSQAEKHMDDNRRRLETIRERKREVQSRKAAVHDALAHVDSGSRLNKKIVFDSDDDKEETPAAAASTSVTAVSTTLLSPSSDDDDDDDDDNEDDDSSEDRDSSLVKKRMPLFGSSGSSEEEDEDEMFRVRPQYEGEKGSKLMQLQARLGSDHRFRLDERFVESDEEQEKEDGNIGDADMEGERARALRILEEVVGRQPMARMQRQESQRKTFKDVSTLHFDPACEQHRQLEVQTTPKEKITKKKGSKKNKEAEAPEIVVPEVSKERFFEVSSAIQDVFNKTHDDKAAASGFSLMAAFGGQSQTDTRSQSGEYSASEFKAPSGAMNPWQSRFSVDVSDNSSDDDQEQQSSAPSAHTDTVVCPVRKLTFFFSEDDDRLQEGVDFFKRPQDFDSVVEKWREQRPKLIESYREKWRKAVKNKRKLQKTLMWHSGGHRTPSRRAKVNRRSF